MNLSEDLSVDKELFSGVYEGKYLKTTLYISKYYYFLILIKYFYFHVLSFINFGLL